MDQLVECVLPIRPRLAPNNWASGMVHLLPLRVHIYQSQSGQNLLSSPGDILSIALHIALLEVGRKPDVSVIFMQGCLYLDLTE